jgi:hypothetical protein
LALLSLTFRSLLPVGFMLAPSAGDEMTVVICTGHGPLTVTLDADGKPVPTKPKLTGAGLCAYASPGATTLADAAPAPAARDVLYARRAVRLHVAMAVALRLPGASSPRGPPIELI